MAERYLQDPEKDALKEQLYAYLADKAKRRATVTSQPAYEAAEEGFAHQERVADANALGGLMLNAGDRAGTVLGRGPASNFGQFSEALDNSRQQRIGNMRNLRGMEEQSNMNDLGVARYLTEVERGDDARKDKREALYESIMRRRAQDGMNDRKQTEIERANRAREQMMRDRPSDSSSSMKPSEVLGPEGLPLNFEPKTGKYSKAEYPEGAKLRPKEAAEKPLTEGERAAAAYYNNARNAVRVLEELEAKGYRTGPGAAVKGMVTPKSLEGHVFSKDDLLYRQAVRDFVAAKLRLESGASISPSEALEQGNIYMSMSGEPDELLKNKAKSRREALKGLAFKAGRGAEQILKMGDQRAKINMPGDAAAPDASKDAPTTEPPKYEKIPEEMTDDERRAELERLRKAVGQ